MSVDISGFGLQVRIVASESFPSGFTVTAFTDDTDPVDSGSIQLRDKAMGLNGDLISWKKANPIPLTLSVLPNTEDDANLSVLAANNRASAGRRPVNDEVTATIIYPDDSQVRLVRGVITDAIMGKPVASAGRLKSKVYMFAFEDYAE